jgi:hypothetical protein
MSAEWHSVYFRGDLTALTPLDSAYSDGGWVSYDPFPGGIGSPSGLKGVAKQIAYPLDATGWIRVVSETAIPPEILGVFSATTPILRGWLTMTEGGWEVGSAGKMGNSPTDFAPFLAASATLESLSQALAGNSPVKQLTNDSLLPPEVQALTSTRKVNPAQAESLMNRMAGGVFSQLGGNQSEAKSMLNSRIDWNSDMGRIVRAVAVCLALPTFWHEPDFAGVKDAYQAARALKRNPAATLLPGEKSALERLPNAGSFKMSYWGKR